MHLASDLALQRHQRVAQLPQLLRLLKKERGETAKKSSHCQPKMN